MLIVIKTQQQQKAMEQGARDYWTIEAMAKFGGTFVKALAAVARRADPTNLRKIKIAWSEYWNEYERMGKKLSEERN